MRSVWLLALAASGCRTILGIGDPPTFSDGGDFASCQTWHPDGFDPCALEITIDALILGDAQYTYDTTTAGGTLYDANHQVVLQSDQTITQLDGSPLAVLSIGRLAIPAAAIIDIRGPKPLLIASWSSIAVDGVINANSHLGITNAGEHIAQTVVFGAGANQGCQASAGHDGIDAVDNGSGGAGGGGFQAAGGGGGASGMDVKPGGAGGAAGPAAIHGGCPGGTSGLAGISAHPPARAGSRALGGAGGGAIRLVAHDSIDVRGQISANGAGGAGAPTNSACGGGGGGSGGYIGFEAPIVRLGGSITANGGGGGGGTDPAGVGNDGADGAVGTQPAVGGAIEVNSCGGAGGAGAALAQLAGSGANGSVGCNGGGGGGGGATGFIIVKSPDYRPGTATLSPAAKLE